MEQRNLLLAIVLSVGILIGFQYLYEKIRPTPPPAPAPAAATQTVPGTAAPGTGAPSVAPGSTPGGTAAAPAVPAYATREAALAEQNRVRIVTPRLHGSIALTGGRID